MGKLFTILTACVVVVGGGGYAFYSTQSECSRCQSARSSACCAEAASCSATVGEESDPAMAVAGPAVLMATVPVKADVVSSCCAMTPKTVSCCDLPVACPAQAIEAVAGSAASVASK